jgi:hypothetical protein
MAETDTSVTAAVIAVSASFLIFQTPKSAECFRPNRTGPRDGQVNHRGLGIPGNAAKTVVFECK